MSMENLVADLVACLKTTDCKRIITKVSALSEIGESPSFHVITDLPALADRLELIAGMIHSTTHVTEISGPALDAS